MKQEKFEKLCDELNMVYTEKSLYDGKDTISSKIRKGGVWMIVENDSSNPDDLAFNVRFELRDANDVLTEDIIREMLYDIEEMKMSIREITFIQWASDEFKQKYFDAIKDKHILSEASEEQCVVVKELPAEGDKDKVYFDGFHLKDNVNGEGKLFGFQSVQVAKEAGESFVPLYEIIRENVLAFGGSEEKMLDAVSNLLTTQQIYSDRKPINNLGELKELLRKIVDDDVYGGCSAGAIGVEHLGYRDIKRIELNENATELQFWLSLGDDSADIYGEKAEWLTVEQTLTVLDGYDDNLQVKVCFKLDDNTVYVYRLSSHWSIESDIDIVYLTLMN